MWGNFHNPFCAMILYLDGEIKWSSLDHHNQKSKELKKSEPLLALPFGIALRALLL
jgi:hypothetical protein